MKRNKWRYSIGKEYRISFTLPWLARENYCDECNCKEWRRTTKTFNFLLKRVYKVRWKPTVADLLIENLQDSMAEQMELATKRLIHDASFYGKGEQTIKFRKYGSI